MSHPAGSVTQTAAHEPAFTRSGHRRRPAGPYLQRRDRIYYFRKRLSNVIAERCRRKFLCLSLRTSLLAEAMSRTAHLLAIVEREETRIMTDSILRAMPAEEIAALLTEALRHDLARIALPEQETLSAGDDDQRNNLEHRDPVFVQPPSARDLVCDETVGPTQLPEPQAHQEKGQAKKDEESGGEHFGSRPVSAVFKMSSL